MKMEQVVVAVMLESFYSARQQFQEEEALGSALKLKHELQERAAMLDAENENTAKTDCSLNFYPLDPVLEDLAKCSDSSHSLQFKLEGFFAW
jgi:hypothetical protein